MNIQDYFDQSIQNNDIEEFKSLLKDTRVEPDDCGNYTIRIAAQRGHFEITVLLLNDPRVDPTEYENKAISYAFKNENEPLTDLLWNDPIVKNTLKKDQLNLYNFLIKKDLKSKVEKF
jgi:hypothetical protein